MQANTSAVTGAFGFTGRHIALKLLSRGEHVLTLTDHPNRRSNALSIFYITF
ncbi:MAG: NAD-dependent epimerase/dehydratase family protein [Armatimonadota bacterium]